MGVEPLRIGLFGGSFDPVHAGHLALACAAQQQLGLDQLRWIPAGQPWQKPRGLLAAEHRLAMLARVLKGRPEHVLDACEINRAGPSYTVQTLRELQAPWHHRQNVQWFLLMGQDQYARLNTWHAWSEVVQRVDLAVVARDGEPPETTPEVLTALRQAGRSVHTVTMRAAAVSSTLLRERLHAGVAAHQLVPLGLDERVADYIEQHGLYRPALKSLDYKQQNASN
ncbi:MAG: nicotinate (nicotinamide) nucleotide adenylyltransferase [Leptothrix ochracea]|uniref:nicotinate (nicotinamide) nucleotide adenylyltransferase n=1 Tax=Leptothrix ochracea TaxID=735331 RepID=UPI0034E1E3F2